MDFYIQKIDVKAQKIDNFCLEIFGIVINIFKIGDGVKKSQYFEEIFLLPDISISVALGMPFFISNNTEINFMN